MRFCHWALTITLTLAPLAISFANEAHHEEKHGEKKTEKSTSSLFEKRPEDKNGEKTEEKSDAQKLSDKVSCEKLPQKTDTDLWNLAECFYRIGVTDSTIQILRSISQKNPKDIEAFFTTSWLMWQEGRARGGAEEKKRSQEALAELLKSRLPNPTHWEVDTEIGDFYYLRMNAPEKAYPEYIKARQHYDGDYSRNVPRAENGRKAAIEDRVARAAEIMDRKGESVEASCRALFFDPDDSSALDRIKRLSGSCTSKEIKDPRKTE
ncbi:MAG: hypothetical protein JST16_12725 [Bdellovibrionales bacterium]|nr:hypothetical protein [Bdellovibrionales bacterium]